MLSATKLSSSGKRCRCATGWMPTRKALALCGPSNPNHQTPEGIDAMFIVLLKFSDNKASASQFMEGHNAWLKRGFDNGVFLLAGSLQPKRGGGILAQHASLAQLQR